MQLLPNNTFSLHTQEPLSTVIEKLAAQIEAPKTFRWSFSRHHVPYEGTINNSGFEIHRIIRYRNSFLPTIRGRFESLSGGTMIHITLKLHPFVTAFLVFWYLVWYSATIPIFLFGALSGDVELFTAFQFLGMPILLLVIFGCAFWYEADRSRRELAQIILGEGFEQQTSGNLTPRVVWIIAIAIIMIWNVASLYVFPSLQHKSKPILSKSCAQDATQSPYCNFIVVRFINKHSTISAIALSSDGKTLVSGGKDKALKVWDLQTGQLRKTFQSDSGEIQTVAIAPDGKTVVSGSGDRMVRIWSITSNQPPKILKGHSSDIRQVRISSDSKTIISSTYSEIKVWDLATGKLKAALPNLPTAEIQIGPVAIQGNAPRFYPLAISPDAKTALIELNSKLVVWNLATNQQTVLKNANLLFQSIRSAHISLDGHIGVITSYIQPKTHLKLWDLTTGKLKAQELLSSSPEQSYYWQENIVLSRDRIFGNTNQGLKVWNLQTGELEATVDQPPMRHLVVSSDGKLLAGITGDPYDQNTQIKVLHRP